MSKGNVIARQYRIIPAPTDLGLKPTGVDRLAQTLISLGLADAIGADVGPTVDCAAHRYNTRRDRETGFLNGSGIRDQAGRLAAAVGQSIDVGSTPIVLGGDCSILIGAALALRRRGRYGLLFVDGHSDYYDSRGSRTGEVAEMDLAVVTGESDPLLSAIDDLRPYVDPIDVVVFGFREEGIAEDPGFRNVRAYGIHAMTLDDVRRAGIAVAIDAALRRVTRPGLDGFFVHFDADVLDDVEMPAVDYRIPGGLSSTEAIVVLKAARQSTLFKGMTVSIYNPALDPQLQAGKTLTGILGAALWQAR